MDELLRKSQEIDKYLYGFHNFFLLLLERFEDEFDEGNIFILESHDSFCKDALYFKIDYNMYENVKIILRYAGEFFKLTKSYNDIDEMVNNIYEYRTMIPLLMKKESI